MSFKQYLSDCSLDRDEARVLCVSPAVSPAVSSALCTGVSAVGELVNKELLVLFLLASGETSSHKISNS